MSQHIHTLFSASPQVVNIGLEGFALELAKLNVPVVHVRWSPPAGADPRLVHLLSCLEERREVVERANGEALARLVSGQPMLIDCLPAREALGLPERTVLHAGPPIEWGRMCEPMRAAVLCAMRYEGWAADDESAARLVERFDVKLANMGDGSGT